MHEQLQTFTLGNLDLQTKVNVRHRLVHGARAQDINI